MLLTTTLYRVCMYIYLYLYLFIYEHIVSDSGGAVSNLFPSPENYSSRSSLRHLHVDQRRLFAWHSQHLHF